MTIGRPEKIGLGIWDRDALGSALDDVDRLDFGWHFTWGERPLWDADPTPDISAHVPMIWDETDVTAQALLLAKVSGATTLLGFNEPDDLRQASMSVEQALDLWPRLEATSLRLGSPACTQQGVLGEDSWLGRFMAGAEERGLRVDFIAVHYYSADKSVAAFKTFLEAVHAQYGKPVWVTEWALADWGNPSRFTAAEQAAFARAGAEMMDDLAFVERHAWFAAYEGGDGWNLNSGLFNPDGSLTPVGRVFQDLNGPDLPPAAIVGTGSDDRLVGTKTADVLKGLAGDDRLDGGSGGDTLSGGLGADRLDGGLGRDTLTGHGGADVFGFDRSADSRAGAARDVVNFSRTDGDRIDLSGIDASSKLLGNQSFRWVDAGDLDAGFTGVAGQLRFAGGILHGDTNGDRKADFQIQVVGSFAADSVIL